MLKKGIITAAVFLLIAGYAPGNARADISPHERAALTDIYISTGGEDWIVSTGWNGSPGTECGWHGVTCDSRGEHVTKLELAGNSLKGNIPESVRNLTSLYAANLSYNSLFGNIPASVGELGMLRALDLGANDLTGAIPGEIGNILSLEYLFLHGNRLSGDIPPELGNLSDLRLLKLGVNELTGAIPAELGKLSDLRYLTLYKNRLEGVIPPELGNLASLLELNLLGNSLTGPVPGELENLANLTPGRSDFRWNALYSGDNSPDTFLSSVQRDGDWKSTQTVAPAGLAAGRPSPESVPLSWAAVRAADEYEVMYSAISGGPYMLSGITVGTDLTVAGPAPGTTWHFCVRSLTRPHDKNSATVRSAYSAEISVTTPELLTLDGPDRRTVYDTLILITGTVGDPQYSAVTAVSDRYPDIPFAAVTEDPGAFSCEVPLLTGANLLTFIARDTAGSEIRRNIMVISMLPLVPKVTITSPSDGTTLYKKSLTVTGFVRSALEPGQITLTLDGQTAVPAGEEGEYAFVFENVGLAKGENILRVVAETAYGSASDKITVTCTDPGDGDEVPAIEIHSPLPGAFLAEQTVVVKGTAGSGPGIRSVTVGGYDAHVSGSGPEVSFRQVLMFPGGGDELQIAVTATDNAGKSASLSFAVRHDSTPPIITLASPGLRPAPEISSVKETPYPLAGTVTEKNLAGISINGKSFRAVPVGADGWYFEGSVGLVRGQEYPVITEAWDYAGNRTDYALTLRLDSALGIEVIAPKEGAKLVADKETSDVDITARIPGIAENDTFRVSIDGAEAKMLALSGTTANGTATVTATDGEHTLTAEAVSAGGDILARTVTHFTIINKMSIPLSLDHQDPENIAQNVEPTAAVVFCFNKPADPGQLDVQVSETAHGLVYSTPEPGADLARMGDIRLTEVHREREPVPGVLSVLPGSNMVAFYPKRLYAYGATVYVTLRHGSEELSRSVFHIRPLPTLAEGFVLDQFRNPLEGIEVRLPGLGRETVTDKEGGYGFGFGESADEAIPPGNHLAVMNPGLKNRAYGTVTIRINAQEGRLNDAGITLLPVLNPGEPFSRIVSGHKDQVLAGGDLTLDLSDAGLIFPDGRGVGDVHAQFAERYQIPYGILRSAMPYWLFAIQPGGIGVSGNVKIIFSMPALRGSHDYFSPAGERVILVGLDPYLLQIVPVGTGLADPRNRRVVSEGRVALKRLDYLGYAAVGPDIQPILERFASGEISLARMIGELESQY